MFLPKSEIYFNSLSILSFFSYSIIEKQRKGGQMPPKPNDKGVQVNNPASDVDNFLE